MSDALETLGTKAEAGSDVRLENFEGPLDLLLHLIKKSDLDIYDIPIADITREYLAYLDLMEELNLEVAGNFLVMASMLMQIKAQLLLPSQATAEEEGPDPRAELVNKLLEYQQYKEASSVLVSFHERAKDTFYRQIPPIFEDNDRVLRASVMDLVAAFKRILDQAPKEVGQILRDEIPLEIKVREILGVLQDRTTVAFEEFFAQPYRRVDVIVTFMAILELVRLKQIIACQDDNFARLFIVRIDAAAALAAEPSEFVEPTPVPSGIVLDEGEEQVAAMTESPVTETSVTDPLQQTVSPVSETSVADSSQEAVSPEEKA